MATITDVMHDAVDAQEDLRARAREITEKLVAERMGEALQLAGHNIGAALEIIAIWNGEALSDITTEAVQTGGRIAARRVAVR